MSRSHADYLHDLLRELDDIAIYGGLSKTLPHLRADVEALLADIPDDELLG